MICEATLSIQVHELFTERWAAIPKCKERLRNFDRNRIANYCSWEIPQKIVRNHLENSKNTDNL